MKVYLAGPDVFLPDALEIGRRKVEICRRHGLIGLYPLDNVVDCAATDASLEIFKANEAMMDQADAIIANLMPFRGPGADAGTAYELGYMSARGKFCLVIPTTLPFMPTACGASRKSPRTTAIWPMPTG